MSIRSYQKDGVTLYKAYVSQRSKKIPSIRKQLQQDGITSEKEALKIEKDLIRDAQSFISEREAKGATWREVVDAYLQNEIAQRARGLDCLGLSTQNDYESMVHIWTRNWLQKPARDINQADVSEILQLMKDAEKSNSLQAKFLQVVKKIYEYGLNRRLILGVDRNPCESIRFKRRRILRQDGLNAKQLGFFLSKAKELNPTWYPIWALAVYTGMRSGEMYALRWKNVDFDSKTIKVEESYSSRIKSVKCTKSGEIRIVPINEPLELILKGLRAKGPNEETVLPRNWRWDQGQQADELRKFLKGIGLPEIRFHDLRACFASELIKAKVAPITVMQMCGWKDLKTMAHYIRRAGIEVSGATDILNFEMPQQIGAKVVDLFAAR